MAIRTDTSKPVLNGMGEWSKVIFLRNKKNFTQLGHVTWKLERIHENQETSGDKSCATQHFTQFQNMTKMFNNCFSLARNYYFA